MIKWLFNAFCIKRRLPTGSLIVCPQSLIVYSKKILLVDRFPDIQFVDNVISHLDK